MASAADRIAGTLRRSAVRAALLIAIATAAPVAGAQGDCLTGFNCGRVAWIEDHGLGAPSYRLWTANVDGSRRSTLLEFGPGNHNFANGLVFSHDSRKLFFTASAVSSFDMNIFSINVDGTGLTNLTNDSCFNNAPSGYGHSLSPDGSKLVFVRNCGPLAVDAKIWVMNVDGSGQRLLTTSALVNSDPTGDEHRSPQFSPDGSRIVFTSQAGTSGSRQVYLSSLDGATVVALTSVEAFSRYNDSPRFTPDGRIVFASRRDREPFGDIEDLYRMDADGGNLVRVTNLVGRKFGIAISPDSGRIVFGNDPTPEVFDDGTELYVVRSNGTDLITLSNDPTRYPFRARFSADGTRIGFELGRFSANDGPVSTRVVNVDGSDPIDYASPTEDIQFDSFGRPDVDGDGIIDGADSCPLAPNGYRIAMSSNRIGNYEIWTTDFQGGTAQRLTNITATDTAPRFDASGSRIVFHSNRFNSRNEIFSMNADGSGLLRLTNVAGNNITPAFSPDATRITFIASRDGAQRNVWIMDADGSNQVKLTTNQGFSHTANNPVFNHDGTRITFDSDRNPAGIANHDIFSIRPDGSDEIRLTTATGRDTHPAYSADGSRIVFISFRDGESFSGEIYTMNADGSDQRRVTNGTFREIEPAFTADGAQIVFRADDHGESEIYVINRDGSGRRRITDSAGFNTNPTAAPQADRDGDGAGDACDDTFDVATGTGSNVAVDGPGAGVEFTGVTSAGTTSFTPITPDPAGLPAGYALCETCTAFEISTTAAIVPPITVCIDVPAALSAAAFQALRLLHGENGNWVDRTAFRIDQPGLPRQVCGIVQSLSPFALASQRAPSSSAMAALPGYSRLDETTTFSVVVDGGSAAPVGGQVEVEASTGESCIAFAPQSTVGPRATFACGIAFLSHGPREVIAHFSGSTSHADSSTPAAAHAVVRLVDVAVDASVLGGAANPGEATSYRVELRNAGPDAAPATRLTLVALPALLGQAWTCTALGDASCPAVGGSGDVDALVDLPPGSGLDYVLSGTLPANLPAAPELRAVASVDAQAPNFVRDAAPANNTDVASGAPATPIFNDGFEGP